MTMTRQLIMLLMLVVANQALQAQLRYLPVPACGDPLSNLRQDLTAATSPDTIRRVAAVGGESTIPLLQKLSVPEQLSFTIAGTAQSSLAGLGDEDSIEQLKQELQKNAKVHSVAIFDTILKLGAARSDASLSILAEYVIQNRHNEKRRFDYGDTSDDPLKHAIQQLIAMLEDPPFKGTESPYYESQLDGWQKWWETTKPPRITPIYASLSEPQAQCLARYAEWGYADEVFRLYSHFGRDSIPALHRLARLGDKSWPTSPLDTVRGNAQTIVAKEGDDEQFQRIVRDLDDRAYPDAIRKLRYIGGKKSVEALLHALTLSSFMRSEYWKTRDQTYVKAEGRKLQRLAMDALATMFKDPPLPPSAEPTPDNIHKWEDWWTRNKGSAPLRPLQ